MVIVKMMGGLGNQMFQYALYKWFEMQGIEVKADLCFYEKSNVKYQLEELFGIHARVASRKEIEKLQDSRMTMASRIRRKLCGKRKTYLAEDVDIFYNFVKKDNLYLDGYWQNERYFFSIKSYITELYGKTQLLSDYQVSVVAQIREGVCASVHVRRGDYMTAKNQAIYGGICTLDYYDAAIKHLYKKYNVKRFFVFSDDEDWARNQFVDEEDLQFIVVKVTDDRDLFLMSECTHNIIANSSYSWWGAWLNKNREKEIIAPAKWLNGKICEGIYCDGWSLIDYDGKIKELQ